MKNSIRLAAAVSAASFLLSSGCATRTYEFPVNQVYLPKPGHVIFVTDADLGNFSTNFTFDPSISDDDPISISEDIPANGTNWVSVKVVDYKFLDQYALKSLKIHVASSNDVRWGKAPTEKR